MEGLEVPTFDGSQEYLYWVGCSGALVDRNIPIDARRRTPARGSRRQLRLSRRRRECNGDPARRLGNEYLYQMQARRTSRCCNAKGVQKIITNCPHCFNTFTNEYPMFEWQVRGDPPQLVPGEAAAAGALQAEARAAARGHLPRLLLPRAPQRRLRRPARHRRCAAGRRTRRDAAQPREQLLLRRRRLAHVGRRVEGQAHQRRARRRGDSTGAQIDRRRRARSASRCSKTASRRSSRTKRSA